MLTPGRLRGVIVAALGAGVFALRGLPLPFLLGPLVACLVPDSRACACRITGALAPGCGRSLAWQWGLRHIQQPVDLMPTLCSDAQQLGLLFGRQDYPLRRDAAPQDPDLGLEQPQLRIVPGHEQLGQEDDKQRNIGVILPGSTTALKKIADISA